MTPPRPLALSHSQFILVMTGANNVPVEYRDRYLQCIADRLTNIEVDDDAVQRAVTLAVQRMAGAPSP